MQSADIWSGNRVILSHFDSYSAALLFVRWGETLLLPGALSGAATPMSPPDTIEPHHEGDAVLERVADRYGLEATNLVREADFDEWMQTDAGPVRVHLLRFTTFEAPHATIELHGGTFKPISALRGADMRELNLLRRVFNLIVGGQKG